MTTTSAPAAGPGALVGAVRRAMAALREDAPGTGAGAWGREVREAALAELDAMVTELTLYRGHVLMAHKQAGRWGSVSDRDFADYRSRTTGAGRGAAIGEVQLAEGLEAMPVVAGAVARGELSLEHAKTLSRLRREGSGEVQRALADGALDELVERAAREQLTAPELGKRAKAWAAQVDAAAAQEEFDAVRRRRSLTMRKHAGGIAGEFFLDPVAGEELRTALEAISGRPGTDDERTRTQRMADALSTMGSRTLQVGADLTGAQVRPHLSLLVSEETWAGIAQRRRDAGCVGTRPLPQVAPAEMEDGTMVPVRELERLMCDCETTRMVMDAAGVPLDVGRTQRTYTKELRRAITTRDRHCQWPGCRLRASWCEVHHITWFSRGGVTSVEEGICQCSYHHHLVHQLDVRITVLPDGFDFHYPDGRHIGTTRRSTPPEPRLPDPDATRHASAEPCATSTAAGFVPAPISASAPANAAGRANAPAQAHGPPAGRRSMTVPVPAPAPVKVLPPPRPSKMPSPAVATQGAPLPSHPGTYASAPATLWDSDPPF